MSKDRLQRLGGVRGWKSHYRDVPTAGLGKDEVAKKTQGKVETETALFFLCSSFVLAFGLPFFISIRVPKAMATPPTTKLTDLPPETLSAIARWTGWSPAFQQTCTTVSRLFTGPLYQHDTCLARFYGEYAKAWSTRPSPAPIGTSDDAIQLTQTNLMMHDDDVRYRVQPPKTKSHSTEDLWVYSFRISPSQYVISDLRLLFPTSVYTLHLEIELLHRGSRIARMNQHLVSGLPVDELRGIPLFRGFMPLFVNHLREHSPIDVVVRHYDPNDAPFHLLIRYCPSDTEMRRVMHRIMRNVSYNGWPRLPHGWALRFPLEDLAQGIAKIIFRLVFRTKPYHSATYDVEISGKALGKRHADFPYPLSPAGGFIVIPKDPRMKPRYIYTKIDYKSFTVFKVLYSLTGEEDHLITLENHFVYYLDELMITYLDGRMILDRRQFFLGGRHA